MIVILKKGATNPQINRVLKRIKALGLKPFRSDGVERTIIAVIGDEDKLRTQPIEAFEGVERVVPVQKPYKMVSREVHKTNTVIKISNKISVGAKRIVIMAGPCTVESAERLLSIATKVKTRGATVLRGGAFKPRTSPYDFQGLGENGLKFLADVKKKVGLPIISEIMDVRDAKLFEKYVDVVQIGARNMQNFSLLKEVGKIKKPVLLKRGMGNTIKEFLMAAEYLYAHGNHNVILCERGIRTFDQEMRFTLDVGAVPVLKRLTHFPIAVDPSHPSGDRGYVPALARAAIAAGADALIVEVHDDPENALCDGPQALLPEDFSSLMKDLKGIARVLGRTI